MDSFVLCDDKRCSFFNTPNCFAHYHLTIASCELIVRVRLNAFSGDCEVGLYTKNDDMIGVTEIHIKPDFKTLKSDVEGFLKQNITLILKTLGALK